MVSRDFVELFECLRRHEVKAIVVGAHAVAFHAKPRYTKDIDVLIEPSEDNARKLEQLSEVAETQSRRDLADPVRIQVQQRNPSLYGVAELPVPKIPELVGQTLKGCGRREKDMVIWSLHGEGKVITNPEPSREYQVGDRWLCFGNLESMRGFIPKRKRRWNRRKQANG